MKTPNHMHKYVSAIHGTPVDMDALIAQNGDTVAVTGSTSSVRMNGRGDILGRNGKVRQTRAEIEQNYHKELEGNVHKPEPVAEDVFISPADALAQAMSAAKEKEATKSQPIRKPSPARIPPKARTLIEDDNENEE